MEEDEAANPVGIHLFRADTGVLQADRVVHLIKQLFRFVFSGVFRHNARHVRHFLERRAAGRAD